MKVQRVVTVGELARCLEIRRKVFIEEQRVPEDLELDQQEGECTHFLATDGDLDVGTARLKPVDGKAKAQRVAVLPSHRNTGVGKALMDALEAEARAQGMKTVVLSSQVSAIPFYERLGYAAHGDVYKDAGIDHRDMSKSL